MIRRTHLPILLGHVFSEDLQENIYSSMQTLASSCKYRNAKYKPIGLEATKQCGACH